MCFDEYFKKYSARISGYLGTMGIPSADVEDILQETFVTAYTKYDQLKEQEKIGSWLFTIACNNARNFFHLTKKENMKLKTYTRFKENIISYNSEKLDLNEKEKKLRFAISLLSADQRESIGLYLQGLTYKEIAEILSEKKSTINGRIQKARIFLRDYFNKVQEKNYGI